MSSELREDCLISILRLSEGERPVSLDILADFMGQPRERALGVVKVLSEDGQVELSGDQVRLTDEGTNLAREVRKKHHVMESFLVNVLGMDHAAAHDQAHKMEHTMTQESMQKLCNVVGNNVDNDCSACNNPCNTAINIHTTVLLFEMSQHMKGKIGYLRGRGPNDVKKLISMGFVPGRDISIESRISENGPRIVQIGDSTVALDADLTKSIYVNVDE